MPSTPTTLADEHLTASAKAGDDVALRRLVARYRPMIHGMASDRFLPGGDTDDLIQEGMIGLWHAIRDFDPESGPFGAFARLCADRQMWGAVTKANRQRNRVLRDAAAYEEWMDVPDPAQDPAVLSVTGDAASRLHAHIRAALSNLEKEVLTRYAAGDSYDDIASALEVHRKRIDNALQRARRKIQSYQEQEALVAVS